MTIIKDKRTLLTTRTLLLLSDMVSFLQNSPLTTAGEIEMLTHGCMSQVHRPDGTFQIHSFIYTLINPSLKVISTSSALLLHSFSNVIVHILILLWPPRKGVSELAPQYKERIFSPKISLVFLKRLFTVGSTQCIH